MESSNYFQVAGISTSVDEFHIRQTTYKMTIKLEPESGPPLPFTTAYTNNPEIPAPLYCIRRSSNLPTSTSTKGSKSNVMANEIPPYFSFHFELERDIKTQKMESCTLYLKRAITNNKTSSASLIKYAVSVDCPCKTEKEEYASEKKIKHAADLFPDCNKADMIDFHQYSRLQVSRHTHNCQSYGLSQTFLITITEFDFSEAIMVPYEAQRILAKRTFEKEVRGTGGAYFDELRKPFDVTIICKDGYEIDVHGFVLSTRNSVFRKMLSGSISKLSGRGSSFKRFLSLGKGDRIKKLKTITIDESEISSVAMEVLLHFIYFGELHSEWRSELVGVLHGAKKYGLKELMDFLNVLMITMCKRNNALYLLRLAEKYALKGAEKAISDYIFINLGVVLQASVKITSV